MADTATTAAPARAHAASHTPYLSIVACSRNDGHGENLIERMQLFVEGIADQAGRFNLDCELLLVDWNPPAGKPGLAEVLRYPDAGGRLVARIVIVPAAMHARIPHSDALPLFQMIAKNVGIRRARGRMVLSTNIDILFPDTLFALIAKRDLDEDALYRADRADIAVPFGTPQAADAGRVRELTPLRVNRRDGTYDADGHRIAPIYTGVRDLLGYRLEQWRDRSLPREIRPARPVGATATGLRRVPSSFERVWRLLTVEHPHVNACGDFMLMSRWSWIRVGGYAEWPMYSWNIDALLVHQARAFGIREVDLTPECAVLHMDHSRGSGWTLEGAGELFARMAARGVPVFADAQLAAEARRLGASVLRRRRPRRYNDASWGYGDNDLPITSPPAQ